MLKKRLMTENPTREDFERGAKARLSLAMIVATHPSTPADLLVSLYERSQSIASWSLKEALRSREFYAPELAEALAQHVLTTHSTFFIEGHCEDSNFLAALATVRDSLWVSGDQTARFRISEQILGSELIATHLGNQEFAKCYPYDVPLMAIMRNPHATTEIFLKVLQGYDINKTAQIYPEAADEMMSHPNFPQDFLLNCRFNLLGPKTRAKIAERLSPSQKKYAAQANLNLLVRDLYNPPATRKGKTPKAPVPASHISLGPQKRDDVPAKFQSVLHSVKDLVSILGDESAAEASTALKKQESAFMDLERLLAATLNSYDTPSKEETLKECRKRMAEELADAENLLESLLILSKARAATQDRALDKIKLVAQAQTELLPTSLQN